MIAEMGMVGHGSDWECWLVCIVVYRASSEIALRVSCAVYHCVSHSLRQSFHGGWYMVKDPMSRKANCHRRLSAYHSFVCAIARRVE